MGNGGYSQFITHCFCCSFPPQGEDSSHSSPAPVWSPTHARQFSKNCSNVSPSYEVQSFRNRLLQHGSPLGSQALPANLLWHGLLSPWVCRSWKEPAPARDSPRGHSLLQASPPALAWGPFHGLKVDICSAVDLHGLQGENPPHHGLHHKRQGKALCSGISSTSSPSFFTDLGVCRVVSFTSSHSSLSTAISPQLFFFPSPS